MAPALERLDAPPLFLLGSAASGANWVYEFLTAYPGIAGVRESWVFATGGPDAATRARTLLDGALGPDDRFVVEKSAVHIFHVEEIAEAFPDARFVHVLRDGRDVALKVWRDARDRPKRWKETFGTSLKTAARAWSEAVASIEEARPSLGERLLEIRFEDLNFDHFNGARRILEFAGIDFDSHEVLRILEADENRLDRPDPPEPWKTNYSNWRAWRFDRVAGEMLVKTRYAEDRAWWFRPFLRN